MTNLSPLTAPDLDLRILSAGSDPALSPLERIAAALERIAAALERQEARRESAAAQDQQALLDIYGQLHAEMDVAYQRLAIAERMAARATGPRSAAAPWPGATGWRPRPRRRRGPFASSRPRTRALQRPGATGRHRRRRTSAMVAEPVSAESRDLGSHVRPYNPLPCVVGQSPRERPNLQPLSPQQEGPRPAESGRFGTAGTPSMPALRAALTAKMAAGREALRQDWADMEVWESLARGRRLRLPASWQPVTTAGMRRWLARLGVTVDEYLAWAGERNLREFSARNPSWSMRAWAGLVLEALDEGRL
ncbi:MAG: hypothetical protein ACM3US_07370 [Sphingomonadaceae bacterium]